LRQIQAAAIVAAVALVAACGVNSTSVSTDTKAQTREPGATVSDPNDFYYFDGKPVPLDRATSEFVLGVAAETDLSQVLKGSAGSVAGDPIVIRGRRFVVVRVDQPRADAMTKLMEAMRSRDDVWFASPIYYQPASRARVVPTDELIVRTKPAVTSNALSGVLETHGLTRVTLMDGTTDQYLLRIASAKNADVLKVARTLFGTGLFQWAEPDFIQEYRREG